MDATSSPEKANVADKDQVVAPKEEVQAKPESKKEIEDALTPVTVVSGQDREANEAQPATTPAEVQKGVADNTKRYSWMFQLHTWTKPTSLVHSQLVSIKLFHTNSSPVTVC